MEIKALVKFNDHVALVLDKAPVLKYKRLGNLIYGTDGLFYTCFYHASRGGDWQAFAGRKFEIELESGEVIKCAGQWWDGGYSELSEKLGIKLTGATAKSIEGLKRCYVFAGYRANRDRLYGMMKQHDGPIYPYRDYEKIINYDDMRSKAFWSGVKADKAKKHLIKKVKSMSKLLRPKE